MHLTAGEPNLKPKKFSLLMPPDLHARCVEAAKADHRSLNSWLLEQVRQSFNRGMWDVDGVLRPLPVTTYPAREEKLHS